MLTDHYYSMQELDLFGRRIAAGEPWVFDERTTDDFVAEYIQALHAQAVYDASEALVNEYRDTLDTEEREFIDEMGELVWTSSALLWRYGHFQGRVARAHTIGGWDAALAEFQKIQAEDPRLWSLEIMRSRTDDIDSYIVNVPARPTVGV